LAKRKVRAEPSPAFTYEKSSLQTNRAIASAIGNSKASGAFQRRHGHPGGVAPMMLEDGQFRIQRLTVYESGGHTTRRLRAPIRTRSSLARRWTNEPIAAA
jgi:hypothetical protein